MKTTQRNIALLVIPMVMVISSCTEELPDVTGKNHLYQLKSVSDQQVDGHVKIRERVGGAIQLELALDNVNSSQTYLAYIHFNNALEGGGVALTLTPVDGHSPTSVTEISSLDSGSPITYEELLQFDGHLNIQLGHDPGMIVSSADIGTNALTGLFQQFNLTEADIEGVSGLMTVEERESGFSLVTIEVDGTNPEKQHPVTLNFGSILEESGVAATLNPVSGETGISQTHIEALDGNLVANYQALTNFQGFARVHLGEGAEMSTILAQGNIAYAEN